uniref:Mating type protein 1-1-3 n=10 Tax=Calonectria TaxID=57138 RepID=A0A7S5WT34_9HYPO|nr:mating type protein 1-1-3 [Calonectria pauciramosa]
MRNRADMPQAQPEPPLDHPLTFVVCGRLGDVQVFLPETFDIRFVRTLSENLSRQVNQPVKVFHDWNLQKYRLCPLSLDVVSNPTIYGNFCFESDMSSQPLPNTIPVPQDIDNETQPRIPRPKNKWILYRQSKSAEVIRLNPGVTATEISRVVSEWWKNETPEIKAYWQAMAEEEERQHKILYPDYKYTTKRSPTKSDST